MQLLLCLTAALFCSCHAAIHSAMDQEKPAISSISLADLFNSGRLNLIRFQPVPQQQSFDYYDAAREEDQRQQREFLHQGMVSAPRMVVGEQSTQQQQQQQPTVLVLSGDAYDDAESGNPSQTQPANSAFGAEKSSVPVPETEMNSGSQQPQSGPQATEAEKPISGSDSEAAKPTSGTVPVAERFTPTSDAEDTPLVVTPDAELESVENATEIAVATSKESSEINEETEQQRSENATSVSVPQEPTPDSTSTPDLTEGLFVAATAANATEAAPLESPLIS
jgi:hypothetical protein